MLASLRFDHDRVIVVARHKVSQQHPSAVQRGGVGAAVRQSTQTIKMWLELLGELLTLRGQIGKEGFQRWGIDVLCLPYGTRVRRPCRFR